MHKKKLFILNLFLIIFLFKCMIFADFLDEINKAEKLKIKLLFEHLFKKEPFAYTLFCDKPLSFSDILFPLLSSSALMKETNIDVCTRINLSPYLSGESFEEAWSTWEKYQDKLVNKEKYIFTKVKMFGRPLVLIVNIEQLKNTFNQHLDIFQDKFDSPDLLIQKIKDPEAELFDLLGNTSLGILLGFGEHNSKLFELRELKERKMHQLSYLSSSSKTKKKLQKQIDHLWEILCVKEEDLCCSRLSLGCLITFASNPNHEETLFLNRKYKEQSAEVREVIYANDWFEQILLKLGS